MLALLWLHKKIKGKFLNAWKSNANIHLNSNNNCIHNIFSKQKWKIVLKKWKGGPLYVFCPGVDKIKGGKPQYGIENSLEMKSMFVFDVEKNGGFGYGSSLFKRILEVSRQYNALSIHGAVSEEVPQTMAFLKNRGFVVKEKFPIKYKKGFNDSMVSIFFYGIYNFCYSSLTISFNKFKTEKLWIQENYFLFVTNILKIHKS